MEDNVEHDGRQCSYFSQYLLCVSCIVSSSVVLLVSFTISPVAGISYVSLFYRLRITRTVRPVWVIAPISCSIVQRVCSRKALFVRKVFISCNDHSDLRQSDVKVSLIPFYLIFYWYTFSIVLSHLFVMVFFLP